MEFIKNILDGITARLSGDVTTQKLSKSSDIALAVLIIAFLSMIILPGLLPLNPNMIDYLVPINFTITFILLLVAIIVPTRQQLSVFPGLLFITTLFQLAISLVITRFILLQVNAGEIISRLGAFFVGGELIVGFIIFFIIMIALFLAIRNIAKRMTKLAASADSQALEAKLDHKADMETLEMRNESQFYHAMDNAMKSVQRSNVASLILLIISAVGGLVLGILFFNISGIREAFHVFGPLIMGAGLVFLLPILLISIAAQILTKRIVRKDT